MLHCRHTFGGNSAMIREQLSRIVLQPLQSSILPRRPMPPVLYHLSHHVDTNPSMHSAQLANQAPHHQRRTDAPWMPISQTIDAHFPNPYKCTRYELFHHFFLPPRFPFAGAVELTLCALEVAGLEALLPPPRPFFTALTFLFCGFFVSGKT